MSLHTLSTTNADPSVTEYPAAVPISAHERPVLRPPRVGDAAQIWRVAKNSRVLDTNSSYAYLLWCRDFASTSVVAELGGRVVGFVIGYLRPQAPETVFVWQVAVEHEQRGRGIGAALLDTLLDTAADAGVSALETTIAPDNPASVAMFAAVARRRSAHMTKQPLFEPDHFPDSHAAEDLYLIAPTARKQEVRR
ncbi:diaminobutyrate acetyltransferase [Nocardia sp. NBC_00565]|uniref:diaminobutyrate acetyltransferase n=1 Tax=Nocardia sp. NBC_00565 TaxID=2975993 RepID=UPI002E80B03A|nr:diaminobutyrate acetyltransferase [Nocardia sp. NBC_00565]WUC06035.1 diaminobutyrate acetyltransferase [Nocardia sp. NBC_00565]